MVGSPSLFYMFFCKCNYIVSYMHDMYEKLAYIILVSFYMRDMQMLANISASIHDCSVKLL